jgi:hypothetical protein
MGSLVELTLFFPMGSIVHKYDQRVGYPTYTAQLQPAAANNMLRKI